MSGWYLKSTSGDKSWNDAKIEWGWQQYTFYTYIYELIGEPIPQETNLINSNWNPIDITTNPTLLGTKGYWVKVLSQTGGSVP